MEDRKPDILSFFGLHSPAVKPLVSSSGQFEAMCPLPAGAGSDEPKLCCHRQNAAGLRPCRSSAPTILAKQSGISVLMTQKKTS